MHAVPIAADSSTAGEFDQQWEFGFNSDINAASASEASSDSDDSDAGYVSSVYGDREPSSDSKSEDSGVINEAFGRNTSPVFVGANVDEARNDDDSGLSSSMSSAGGSGDSESEVSIDEDADAEDGEDEGFEDVSALHGTVIQIKGYQYTKVRQSSRKILFRCSFYRRTSGCKGKVEFCLLREAFINFAPHTCGGGDRAPCRHVDVMDDMKAEVDRLAISNLSQTPLQIWRLVRDSFFERDDDAVVQGLTRQQVTQRVYRTRRLHFGGNVHGMFEVAPQSHVSGTTLNFFPFHQTIMEGDRLQRIIGWVDPRLLELLRYPGAQMFVDGTFRCVPRSFYQCVVLMVSDAASGVFVPCVYALATGKSNLLYRKMMTCMNDCTGNRLRPGTVVCDFETALIDSVMSQFREARVIGCLFHFKQAIRRRMLKLRISLQEITIAMEVGVLDMLTVVVPEHVDPHGINFVTELIMGRCRTVGIEYSTVSWARFWVYFRKTWINTFSVDVWNVFGMDLNIVSRTNNPLERFNRELNAAIAAPHPSIPAFISTIDTLSRRYVQLLNDISNRRAIAPVHGAINLPDAVDLNPRVIAARRRSTTANQRGGRGSRSSTTLGARRGDHGGRGAIRGPAPSGRASVRSRGGGSVTQSVRGTRATRRTRLVTRSMTARS